MKNLWSTMKILLLAGFFYLPLNAIAQEGPPFGRGPEESPITPSGRMHRKNEKLQGQAGSRQERFQQLLKTEAPEVLAKLESMRNRNPELAEKALGYLRKDLFHLAMATKGRKANPETKKAMKQMLILELDSYLLAEDYRDADSDKVRFELKNKLESTLVDAFDAKLQLQEQHIKQLTRKLEQLKTMVAKRHEQKNAIIDSRLNQLTGESKHLEW